MGLDFFRNTRCFRSRKIFMPSAFSHSATKAQSHKGFIALE